MLTFYYAPKTCALAVHIVLEQIAAPYEAVAVDFANHAQRSAEYLAINPKGRVPVLETKTGIQRLSLFDCTRRSRAPSESESLDR